MISLKPDLAREPVILALGAHCDDIEIGCGATLYKLREQCPNAKIVWVVFASNESRKQEAIQGAELFVGNDENLDLRIYEFRDGFLPYHGIEVKEAFENIKAEINPDIVFTHYRHDLHQDHRLVSELTWNTFRNHQIFEYEIPKWDGDIGQPSVFSEIPEDLARKKIELLQSVYNSQNNKAWFTDDLFWSLMRIRGMESNSSSRLAEAFYVRKAKLLLEF